MCATTARSPVSAAPAAAFFYSADRGGVHPDAHLATYAGLMQADAYAGFNPPLRSRPQTGADRRGDVLGTLSGAHFYLRRRGGSTRRWQRGEDST